MNKIKVKYCGLTTLKDVDAAIKAGVAAIGLVFVAASPRYISPKDARPLAQLAQQAGIDVVALFADHKEETVRQVIDMIKPEVLQFHGQESAQFCQQFKHTYWKAIPMLETNDIQTYMSQYPDAEAFLLDSFGQQQSGGSGQVFKWFKFPQNIKHKLILAGGLDAGNINSALTTTGAHFIDTSSGIESSPGVKSKSKMLALANKVNSFQSSINDW